ncbi:hypothetical protein A3L09_06965 [Thermococcus profundus]|uniref:Uncharacterized protein n=1 Tax=Thermococcus profundus TaxID=49899 RepID=A0A2Z2MGI6_THEPR|nr:hypothetical protein [Thermococcus profundus]ASJ03014.1 hypothetical protein A3L09_06965 [Thermococcus profundus]
MGHRKNALLAGEREFLLIGAGLVALSAYFGPAGLLAFGIGIILYTWGLYLWSVDIDSRPLILFIAEAGLMTAGILAINWWIHRTALSPTWGFGRMVFTLLAGYPFFVAAAVLYRIRMGIFAGETEELGFNLAGNVVLIGALLFPLLIGVPLFTLGRFIEMFYLWKMPLIGSRVDYLPFAAIKKIGGIALSALLIGGLAYYAVTPDYDFSIVNEAEKIALYGKAKGSLLDLTLLYAPRTCGSNYKVTKEGIVMTYSAHTCEVEVYVDGNKLNTGTYEAMEASGALENLFGTPGVGIVRITFQAPGNASTVVVSFEGEENVTFQLPLKR